MKKLLATLLVLGSGLTLAACESTSEGYRDLQPPYADDRTVGTEPEMPMKKYEAPKRAERVFQKAQTK